MSPEWGNPPGACAPDGPTSPFVRSHEKNVSRGGRGGDRLCSGASGRGDEGRSGESMSDARSAGGACAFGLAPPARSRDPTTLCAAEE